MFVDLSWSHMLLVLVVALVVVGPKDLPKVMRTMGQWAAKARGMADQFRKSFDDMARQSELDELRKEVDALRTMRPLADTEQAMSQALSAPFKISIEDEPKVAEPAERIEEGKPAEPIDEGRPPAP
jgi:sec-independent protein translocase protein TatB